MASTHNRAQRTRRGCGSDHRRLLILTSDFAVTDGNFIFDAQPPVSPDEGDGAQIASPIPELPLLGQRWTVRRKAAVVEAVRGCWVPVEELSRLYDLSADEILAWERDLDRYGVPGLRSTRLQIYRLASALVVENRR